MRYVTVRFGAPSETPSGFPHGFARVSTSEKVQKTLFFSGREVKKLLDIFLMRYGDAKGAEIDI